MKNIVKELGATNFARIRVGFKPTEPTRIPLIDLVLSGIKGEDKELFENATSLAGKAGLDFAKGISVQNIMQKYNGKGAKN